MYVRPWVFMMSPLFKAILKKGNVLQNILSVMLYKMFPYKIKPSFDLPKSSCKKERDDLSGTAHH